MTPFTIGVISGFVVGVLATAVAIGAAFAAFFLWIERGGRSPALNRFAAKWRRR